MIRKCKDHIKCEKSIKKIYYANKTRKDLLTKKISGDNENVTIFEIRYVEQQLIVMS